jgi:hypothetical protein
MNIRYCILMLSSSCVLNSALHAMEIENPMNISRIVNKNDTPDIYSTYPEPENQFRSINKAVADKIDNEYEGDREILTSYVLDKWTKNDQDATLSHHDTEIAYNRIRERAKKRSNQLLATRDCRHGMRFHFKGILRGEAHSLNAIKNVHRDIEYLNGRGPRPAWLSTGEEPSKSFQEAFNFMNEQYASALSSIPTWRALAAHAKQEKILYGGIRKKQSLRDRYRHQQKRHKQ